MQVGGDDKKDRICNTIATIVLIDTSIQSV